MSRIAVAGGHRTKTIMGTRIAAESSSPGIVLACCGSGHDRGALSSAARGLVQVQFCASAGELARHELLARGPKAQVRAIVLDIDTPGARAALPAVVARLHGTAVPLLLRLAVRTDSIRALVAHACSLSGLLLSLRPFDPLGDDLTRLLLPGAKAIPTPRARLTIIARSAAVVYGETLAIVATAAAVGVRAVSVAGFRDACGISSRRLESRLLSAGVMPPKRLLQWILALHATWGVCVADRRPSDVARAMGLSLADLSDRMERATGLRLPAVCDDHGFDGMLERFAELLAAGRGGGSDGSQTP